MPTPPPKPRYSTWKWLATASALLYTAGVFALFVTRAFANSLPPFVALANSFAPFLFLPLLLTLPLGGLFRSKAVLASSLALLVLFIGCYGSLLLPKRRPTEAHHARLLTAMTVNVGPQLLDLNQVTTVIRKEFADIVAVQELPAFSVELLRKELTEYPYTVLAPGEQSTGLLSRYPILTSRWFHSEHRRSHLYALVHWSGVPVHVFAVHPFPPGLSWHKDIPLPMGLYDEEPQRQIMQVAQQMANTDGARIMLGDFNTSDQTRAYAMVAKSFRDAYREAGKGFGFTFPLGIKMGRIPIPGPFVRLDYISSLDK